MTPPAPAACGAWLARWRWRLAWAAALGLCLLTYDLRARKASPARDQPYLYGWDNNHYFAWGRSLALDGDVDFTNDYAFVAGLRGFGLTQTTFAHRFDADTRTATGRPWNEYAPGLGLLSLPALKLAQAAAWAYTRLTGTAVSPFAWVYCLAFVATSMLGGFGGLAAAYYLLRPRLGAAGARAGVLLGTAGTCLLYYLRFEPTMSHPLGFGLVTALALLADRWAAALGGPARVRPLLMRGAGMGALLGLAISVRYSNAVFAAVPFCLALGAWRRAGAGQRGAVARRALLTLLAAAAGLAVALLPMALVFKALFGSVWADTYHRQELTRWPVNALVVLFGPTHSLFRWTPLALLGVLGLAARARRGDALAWGGGVALLATLWIYGCWVDPTLGDSFGMRGFIECSAFLMLGLGALWGPGWGGWRQRARRAGVLLLVGWNLYFMLCYKAEIQPRQGPLAWAAVLHPDARWGRALRESVDVFWLARRERFAVMTPVR